MLIKLTNTLNSIVRRVLSIVKDGLKMWLPFENSEILGEDVITDGTFPNSNNWTEDSGWTISGNTLNKDGSTDNNTRQLISSPFGKYYQITYTISNYVKGGFKPTFGYTDLTERNANGTYTEVGKFATTGAWKDYLRLFSVGDSEYSISNVILKEATQIAPDTSGNSNNATLYTGKALSFDGANDYVNFTSIDLTGEFTIGIWFNVADALSDNGIYGDGTTADNVSIQASGQNFRFRINNSSTTFGFDSGSINTWYRLIITRDSSNLIKCYRDGVASTTTVTDSNTLSINNLGKGFTGWVYNGKASDFQIYDTAWTQADVTFDYDNPQHLVTDRAASSIALSNLKGYWHLSEGDGAINYDSSGEDNDGTINGATWVPRQATIPQLGLMDWAKSTPVADEITLISDPNDQSKDILGNDVRLREHSLNLDGSGYAEVADDDTIHPTDAITVECWVYWDTSSNKGIVSKWQGFQGYMLHKQSATKFDFYIGSQNKRCATALSNGWNHIVGTYDKTNMKVYINGDFDVALAYTSAISNSTKPLEIGRYADHSAYSYSERIDDVRIYDRALSSDEVTQNYNAGLKQHKTGSAFSDDFSSDYGF